MYPEMQPQTLEPFLSRGMKIAKLDRWVMLLQEYDITFVHIRGKDNILADAISQLHTINIYEHPIENNQIHSPTTQNTMHPNKVTNTIQELDSVTAIQLLNITIPLLQNLQKPDKFCKNEVCELHAGIKGNFYLNNNNILKQKVIVDNLEANAMVIPTPLMFMLLHDFHNCRDHQGCARMFNLLKRKFWW